MIKTIKKLFSVDESELDFDEIEMAEEKSAQYEKELINNQSNLNETNNLFSTSPLKQEDILKETGNKVTEINNEIISDADASFMRPTDDLEIVDNSKNDIGSLEITNSAVQLKALDEANSDVITHNVVDAERKATKKSFDFAKEIEEAYEKPYTDYSEDEIVSKPIEKTVEKVTEEELVDKNKNTDELVNKDNYVLKDIISPMRGVIRKETNSIKRDEEVKKAQIIKLRENIKTTELDPDNDYNETIQFPFTDTKDLDEINNLPKEEARDTLSETSKFTLIEDSTGEMRLVIDEDE
ncbi:hypothetical protein LJB88_02825 [Erysipelotrichaceae bacterium OttesenSCG-928-M19]|nr:hypothetical protein [Erysipelotrichaceae bacterium OttesenSCG-928-M19]